LGLPRRRGLRLVPAAMMMAVAVFAMTVPRSGIAPELSPAWRAEQQLAAFWDSAPTLLPTVEMPAPRTKRMLVRDNKPARMIDDALRRRAMQAVERAIATQESPV
jgi:membrane glycosyltransferase